MRKQTLCVTMPICLSILVVGGWLARAGDLDPPAGPVVPTMKTLNEVSAQISNVESAIAGLPAASVEGETS